MQEIQNLVTIISETQTYFRQQAQKQVNIGLTLRNWFFGFYIVEYEQKGKDRAVYGENLIQNLSKLLGEKHLKGFSAVNLRMYRNFYLCYPEIQQSVTVELYLNDFQQNKILQTVSAKLMADQNHAENNEIVISQSATGKSISDIEKMINHLSFTHIIELIKQDSETKRSFYQWQSTDNSWSVRELQRAVNSMLYERTGLSFDKEKVIENQKKQLPILPEDFFKNPYILEFLELKQETDYSESDLEQAIINHLQTFLIELGKGFCFEARQKRITFDNTHYFIDLVFYHRILKCNILIDLKLGEFTHADSGQMNMYLNYYNENEKQENDNPPIGLILCAGKNENLVKYATANLTQHVFVSKYLINLPNENDLKKIIEEEQKKFI
ncbi:PDDEXK nuclease domain-containing protein [Flavobacterium sp. LT1R49]|uniref:PDDEXK nuclease domain-containing protein n=1 Tax=Flavobacterium arabinosi TaxID=3398737 RepID=UPI003A894D9C